MTPQIPGSATHRVPVADGVALSAAVGGSGPAVVLLHGFPQTHLMWRHVAPALATDHMAADVVALARELGHERFALVGHDRGALVAVRAGLDHPDVVTHLGSLDVLPTLDSWDILHGVQAAVAWHLYLMAQPPGLPEAMITATADAFFGSFLDAWGSADLFPADVRAEYLRASGARVPSIVADYRASAGVDVEHDRADRDAGRRLTMPVAVLQQDWGSALGFDAAALWSAWAPDLVHRTAAAGHFMAEQDPELVVGTIRELLAR
jgi:haloacetate dehalogenase